jgi:nitronate monooxygenase
VKVGQQELAIRFPREHCGSHHNAEPSMTFGTILVERLGIEHPIIQAPMAGGGSTPELAAAVCEAGALGFIGAAYLTPSQIREAAAAVRSRTSRPFGINLFAPVTPPDSSSSNSERALALLQRFHQELAIDPPVLPTLGTDPFHEQFAAVLEAKPAVFSFTFGIPPEAALAAAKSRGIFVMGAATTVEEAVQLEHAGVDAVVAQGSEAGAHRGTFATSFEQAMVGTIALVPQVVDAVKLPIVASGGIMDGRGIAAALALGASAVQMGTAFLTSHEAGISEAHKDAILSAREDQTRITRAFSGRPARGIVNRFMREVDAERDAILPYPLQNALTRPLRNAAAKRGRSEFLSLWAGQGLRLARRLPAAELVSRLVNEAEAAVRRIAR